MFELQSVKSVYEKTAAKYPDAITEKAYRNRALEVDKKYRELTPADRGSKGLSYSELTLLSPDGMPIKLGDYFYAKTFEPHYGLNYVLPEAADDSHSVMINQSRNKHSAELKEIIDNFDGDYFYAPRYPRIEYVNPWRLNRIVRELTRGAVVLTAEQSLEVKHTLGENNYFVKPSETWKKFIPLAESLQHTRAV